MWVFSFYLSFLLKESSLLCESFSAYSGKWCAGRICPSSWTLYPTSSLFISSGPLKTSPKPPKTWPKKPRFVPGCACKLCWASKSEDIYPKLLNARNQVRLIAIPSPASQGLGIIPPAAWESRKPGCTKLLWTLFVPNSSSGLLLFVFQLCYLV